MKTKLICSLALFGSALCPTIINASTDPEDYIDFQTGTVPIILLAPHGGSLNVFPDDVDIPRSDNGINVLLNDFRTDDIARRTAVALEAHGLKPYIVVNNIDRRRIDMNRPKANDAAYEDPNAETYYDFFHGKASTYVTEVFNTWGGGILLDIHGQSQDLDLVYRGTQNGLTVTDMISNFGEDALRGPNSIFGQLETLSYDVDPENNEPLNTNPETTFVGGFDVQTYGSHKNPGIDAIQIEYGRNFRDTQNDPLVWQDTADDLTIAVKAYYDTYLVPEPGSLVIFAAGALLMARGRR